MVSQRSPAAVDAHRIAITYGATCKERPSFEWFELIETRFSSNWKGKLAVDRPPLGAIVVR